MSREPSPEPILLHSVEESDIRRHKSAQLGSDALLRAQILSGQHYLSAAAVAAIKLARGWS